MAKVKTLTERSIAERFKEIKDEDTFWDGIAEETRLLAKRIIESSLEEELEARLHAFHYQRTEMRRGWRNGGYGRQLLTRWGILDVRMPRARHKLPPSQVLARFQRREPQVAQLIRKAFLRGVSTREVGDVLEPVLNWRPSAQSVSNLTKLLDAQVRRFHWRRLGDEVQYLFLDGVTMTVKHHGGVAKKLVLVAYGIRVDGKRVLLAFKIATAESHRQWEAFLEDLYRRGIEGKELRLITTDGCPGLESAVEMVYPQVAHQRCWVHKLRNVSAKVRVKHRARCLEGAKKVYQAENAHEAVQRFREWALQWRQVEPKAVRCLERDLDSLLAFYTCPQTDWRKIRTTNAIERCFREVRRRTRPMACFQNNASCDRIVYAVISHLNERYDALPTLSTQHT